MRLSIDGNIGCGKTTIINMLKNHYSNINIIEENVLEWEPFLKEFYKDMKNNSLLFQMKVLEHHIISKNNSEVSIHERSPNSCINIFGEDLYENGYLSKLDIKLMNSYNSKLGWMPDYTIYLKCSSNTCFQRYKKRNRKNEEIPIDYLKNIESKYNKLYEDNNIFIVDAEQNIEVVFSSVLNMIEKILNK